MNRQSSLPGRRQETLRFLRRLLRVSLLYFGYVFFAHLFGGLVDQPHPVYATGVSWFLYRIEQSFYTPGFLLLPISLIVAIDMVVAATRGIPLNAKQLAYYPRPNDIPGLFSSIGSRLVLSVGFLGLAGYWAFAAIEIWYRKQLPHGLIWPGERVLSVFLMAWGILWVAQSLNRPRKATFGAAVAFMILSVLFAIGVGLGVLVE
jgi:hypothetical protein